MHSSLSPNHVSLLITIVAALIFTTIPTPAVSQDDDRYQQCDKNRQFKCADQDNLQYPFWRQDEMPVYCGHPMFELNCSGDEPEITLQSLRYRVVTDVNFNTRVLTVARADLGDEGCTQDFRGTSLNTTYFEFASGVVNLTLHYQCPESSFPNKFKCPDDPFGWTNYYDTQSLNGETISQGCKHSLAIPVLGSSVRNLAEIELKGALDAGFEIVWKANESTCEQCLNSKGICGSDNVTGLFTCYCKNGPSQFDCQSLSPTSSPAANRNGGSGQTSRTVGLSIAGACILGMFIGGLTYYFIQRKKRRTAIAKSADFSTPPSSKSIIVPSTKFSRSTPTASSPSYSYSKSDLEKGSTYFGAQIFTYAELEEATENFDSTRELGEGGFGTVYGGQLRDGRMVAVKRLYENNFRRVEQFMNEIEILTRLQHQNLVKLYGCTSRRSRELLLVYEYIPNGTVADHLHGKESNSGKLSWPIRLSIAVETADALAYLHRSDIIHRDVKTNNILLDNEFRVKVADFGLSKLFPNDVTHVSTAPQGTPGYVDPEYYQCYQLTTKSDVYSFGVVLSELISSLQAVDTSRHRLDINLANMAINKVQNHLVDELIDQTLGLDKDENARKMAADVAGLAFRCLQQERDLRPTMEEVLATLRNIQNGDYGSQSAEVFDVSADEIGLLRNLPPPLSPDSTGTDKLAINSPTPRSY